jgi:hypothetical protein
LAACLRSLALNPLPAGCRLRDMKRRVPCTDAVAVSIAAIILLSVPLTGWAEPSAAAIAGFHSYVSRVEERLARQHGSVNGFVVNVGTESNIDDRLRHGELIIEQLTPAKEADFPGALLHHWRGTAFVQGATAADFESAMKNFSAYPQRYSPDIVRAAIVTKANGDSPEHFVAMMRVRQKHVITVVMDTTYDIRYGHLDSRHGYSISRSTKISEIADPGTAKERALRPNEDHGFLWRLNTYWSYEEQGGGLYIQIETISLTRNIPAGLGWIVRPFVESVPRESLEFTLRQTCKALQNSERIARR